MKAKDLAKLLNGVDPDAEIYIDLGISHDKTKHLIYAMLTNSDIVASPIEHIDMVCFHDNGAKEVYLCPYDGEYDLDDDRVVDEFFKQHGLDKVMKESHE